MREKNENEGERSCGFKRAEEESKAEIPASRNKSRNGNTQNIKETDPQDNKKLK